MNANKLTRSFPAFSDDLYFYYKEIVIKQPLPEFYRNFEDIDDEAGYESYHLSYPEPIYSAYKSKLIVSNVLNDF